MRICVYNIYQSKEQNEKIVCENGIMLNIHQEW